MGAILLTLRRWLAWLFEDTSCTHGYTECQDCLEARTWT